MKVQLTAAAEADLAGIYTYCARRSGPVAERVLGAILRAINGLARFPFMGKPGDVPETRERVVVRYPYRIVYHVNERLQMVEVWRIMPPGQDWPPAETDG